MPEIRPELTKTDFLASYDDTKRKFTLNVSNSSIKLKNYSILLMAPTSNEQKVIIIDKGFKSKGIIEIEDIRQPFFCLLYDTKKEKTTKNSFTTLRNELKQGMDFIGTLNLNHKDYILSQKKLISEKVSEVIQFFSEEKNTDGAIALLQFSFDKETLKVTDVYDFENEIKKRQDMLATLTSKITELEKIRQEVNSLIKSDTNDFIKKDIIEKTDSLIIELKNYKKDSTKNSGPISAKVTEEINYRFESITNEYENLNKKLTENKIILDERLKFSTEILDKLEEFKKQEGIQSIIAYHRSDDRASVFEEGIDRHKQLLLKIQRTPECFSNEEFERRKESHISFLESLHNKKREYEIVNSNKNYIQTIIQAIDTLEEQINLAQNQLYGAALELFHEEKFSDNLSKIKDNLNELLSDKEQLFSCSPDAISEPFKNFQSNYEVKIKDIKNEQNKFEKEIEGKFSSITQELNKHIGRLKGETSISFRDKLINLIFKALTKEKIRLEEQAVHSLGDIKNHIDKFSSSENKNTETLKKHVENLDNILQNKSFTKHRGCLFFRFNPVTSEARANDALTLVNELKAAFNKA